MYSIYSDLKIYLSPSLRPLARPGAKSLVSPHHVPVSPPDSQHGEVSPGNGINLSWGLACNKTLIPPTSVRPIYQQTCIIALKLA